MLSPDWQEKRKREVENWVDYWVGLVGPGIGPGGWLGDGPEGPAMVMFAERRLRNRKAKTPPIAAATAIAMKIIVRRPKLLVAGWK